MDPLLEGVAAPEQQRDHLGGDLGRIVSQQCQEILDLVGKVSEVVKADRCACALEGSSNAAITQASKVMVDACSRFRMLFMSLTVFTRRTG